MEDKEKQLSGLDESIHNFVEMTFRAGFKAGYAKGHIDGMKAEAEHRNLCDEEKVVSDHCNICYNWGIHGCELDVCSFVESKPENKGKWESGLWGYSCSCCGFGASESGLDNYCPNCGAKMQGVEE